MATLKPSLALVAILVFVVMHDMCVAEDAQQGRPSSTDSVDVEPSRLHKGHRHHDYYQGKKDSSYGHDGDRYHNDEHHQYGNHPDPEGPHPPLPPTLSGPAPSTGRATTNPPRLDPHGVTEKCDWNVASLECGNNTTRGMPGARKADLDTGRAVCTSDQPYAAIPAGNTVCKMSGDCTAWFISKKHMVTAGHCVASFGEKQYTIDAANPGKVCCRVLADGSCDNDALFDIRAWVTTRGYFEGRADGDGDFNDGAVLLVEPATDNNIKPQPLKLKTFNRVGVPSLSIKTTGFPCEDIRTCGNWIGVPTPEFGCDASNGIDCKILREWNAMEAPLGATTAATAAGEPITYLGPVCGGHSGGDLVDTSDNKAFGILVSGPCGCDDNQRARSTFSQVVDRGQDGGVWLEGLRAIVPGSDGYHNEYSA